MRMFVVLVALMAFLAVPAVTQAAGPAPGDQVTLQTSPGTFQNCTVQTVQYWPDGKPKSFIALCPDGKQHGKQLGYAK